MIQTRDLSKVFRIGKKHKDEFTAVDGLTLDINQGEVFGFLGPNGAGKTTTVRMLACLIGATRGSARVAGFQVGKDDTEIRRRVGILTESPGMYERLSAEKNLTIYANLYGVPDTQRAVGKYLSILGLWERRMDPVGSFSKGMRQKLAVARALLHEPQVLFLDEPTTGLDPEAAKTVREFIEELKTEGRTIFLTTHNLDEADRLCDTVGIIKQKLLAVDSPKALRDKLFGRKSVFHLRTINPDWVGLVALQPGVNAVSQIGEKLVVSLSDPETQNPAIIKALLNMGAQIMFVGDLRHSLEQVYLDLLYQGKEGGGQ